MFPLLQMPFGEPKREASVQKCTVAVLEYDAVDPAYCSEQIGIYGARLYSED